MVLVVRVARLWAVSLDQCIKQLGLFVLILGQYVSHIAHILGVGLLIKRQQSLLKTALHYRRLRRVVSIVSDVAATSNFSSAVTGCYTTVVKTVQIHIVYGYIVFEG